VVNKGVRTDRKMKKKNYTEEFKQQAIELAASLGSTSEAARQLGISDGSIHSWKMKRLADGKSNAPTSRPESDVEELKRLRSENAQLKKVNHILKSAAAFFSQDHLK
jgi:transposase